MYTPVPELLFRSKTQMCPDILSKENLTDLEFARYYDTHPLLTLRYQIFTKVFKKVIRVKLWDCKFKRTDSAKSYCVSSCMRPRREAESHGDPRP